MILIVLDIVGLRLPILLLECIASLISAKPLVESNPDLSFHYPSTSLCFYLVFLVEQSWKSLCAVTVLNFGHMSSDLLAYGASDGTLTVCSVSKNPSVIKQLNEHSKDVTGWIDCLCFFVLYLILYDMYGHWSSALRQYHLIYYFFNGHSLPLLSYKPWLSLSSYNF